MLLFRLRPGQLWTRVRRPTMASLQTLLSLVICFYWQLCCFCSRILIFRWFCCFCLCGALCPANNGSHWVNNRLWINFDAEYCHRTRFLTIYNVCLLIINLVVNQKCQQIPSHNGNFFGHISGPMPSPNNPIIFSTILSSASLGFENYYWLISWVIPLY